MEVEATMERAPAVPDHLALEQNLCVEWQHIAILPNITTAHTDRYLYSHTMDQIFSLCEEQIPFHSPELCSQMISTFLLHELRCRMAGTYDEDKNREDFQQRYLSYPTSGES